MRIFLLGQKRDYALSSRKYSLGAHLGETPVTNVISQRCWVLLSCKIDICVRHLPSPCLTVFNEPLLPLLLLLAGMTFGRPHSDQRYFAIICCNIEQLPRKADVRRTQQGFFSCEQSRIRFCCIYSCLFALVLFVFRDMCGIGSLVLLCISYG